MAENLKARDGNRLYKAQLLSYYYSRSAESAIGKGARFVISKAYWCKSSLVTANGAGGWNIADIPLDFKLSGAQQFAVSDLILSSVDGIITINAAFPQERMPDNTPYDFNTLVLVDAEEQAFGVLCTQQDTLYKGKRYSILMTIEQVEG
ncbi:phage tail protein [Escherichia coli]|nr:phage tail protein [Escherichia coli]